MALRERVLELLEARKGPVPLRELIRNLAPEPAVRRDLKTVLRDLLSEGAVLKIRGGRVGLSSRMNIVVGRLQCSQSGFGFVVRDNPRGRHDDVYVGATQMGSALHGDRVVVRVERKSPKGLEGKIIRVLERALKRLVGRYETKGRPGGHVVPFDRRVLQELSIPPGESSGASDGEMVVAEILHPPTASRNPSGRILEVLGRLEDKGIDVKVVMAKYELPDAFPPGVEEEGGSVPGSVREEDRAGRTDFRPWPTVTVDPETARDHDDAISLSSLANGHWLLAVHIADVAHYVPEGSLLDQEAYLRGTSVYFPDRVVPMLPHPLSSGICSLVEHEDRLTQSVVMELNAKGGLVRTEFHDGVIRSAARMTYQQVQKIVDGDAELRHRFGDLVDLFEQMDRLAKVMRQLRYERGSLDFDLPEPKVILDSTGEMTGIVASERLDSMRMIEEFMLAANDAVAARLSEAHFPALFRVHEPPDPERVQEFCELVASFGYRIPPNLEEIRPEDFQRILRQIEGKPEERLVSFLLLRTMKLARYHEENLGHFGLASESYAHFTSPIRRYPDLVVHRALRKLRQGRVGEVAENLPQMALHLSEMERRATDAERELVEWKKVRFMAGKLGEVFAGYITGVQPFGFFVELEEVFVQGLVHVSTLIDDYYFFNEKAHTLEGEDGNKVYRLGDRVKVQVVRVDLERRQIDLAVPWSEPPRGTEGPRKKAKPGKTPRARKKPRRRNGGG